MRWLQLGTRIGSRLMAGAALLVLLGACSSSASSRYELPTWCTSGSCVGIPADPARAGTLHASGACVWLDVDGQRARVLWPAGFTGQRDPFVVFDPRGREVARDGSAIRTQMLGPEAVGADACGLAASINLYFADIDGPTRSAP